MKAEEIIHYLVIFPTISADSYPRLGIAINSSTFFFLIDRGTITLRF